MKKFAFAAAAAAVMLSAAPAAFAGEQDFTFHNETGMEIVELYVEDSESEEWGDELLGGEAIATGDSSEISFDGYEDQCKFDIWLKDSKGGKWEVKGVDLCKIHDFVITKKGNGLAWAAQ